MTQDELKMVLEFVKSINLGSRRASVEQQRQVITALEEALAGHAMQEVQRPQRTWVGLTEQDLDYLCNLAYTGDEEFALAVQAKLMEKNA